MVASAECHRKFPPRVTFGPCKCERGASMHLSAGTRTLSPALNRCKSLGNLDAAWSERNPRGQDEVVVVFLMKRHRDLLADAERQADAVVNRNPPDQNPRREIERAVPGVAAIRLPGVVGFKLRPEIFEEAILEGGIPGHRHPQPV